MKVNLGKYPDYDEVTKTTPKRVEEVHIDEYDVWSLDHTLALIIRPALLILKENKQGAPIVVQEDVPEELRMTEAEERLFNKEGETDDRFFERWDYVLDEMIWAFRTPSSRFLMAVILIAGTFISAAILLALEKSLPQIITSFILLTEQCALINSGASVPVPIINIRVKSISDK